MFFSLDTRITCRWTRYRIPRVVICGAAAVFRREKRPRCVHYFTLVKCARVFNLACFIPYFACKYEIEMRCDSRALKISITEWAFRKCRVKRLSEQVSMT